MKLANSPSSPVDFRRAEIQKAQGMLRIFPPIASAGGQRRRCRSTRLQSENKLIVHSSRLRKQENGVLLSSCRYYPPSWHLRRLVRSSLLRYN